MTATGARWARVKELFAQASEQPRALRDAFLDQACQGDRELRAELASLLAASSQAGSFLESPRPWTLEAPSRVGPWEIVRELGRGGMGTVYLARRSDGEYQRQVALKLIRRGLDTEDLLARFRAERQILASLDHPNIARLLDGGTAEDGRPYLVLEYVQGEDVLTWSARHRLSVAERLALFQQLCSAVQFAHQNLVVHRDIKPANVLVAANGVPKLLDFGIAKLLAGGAEGERTRQGMRVLTPSYASPEQLRGERVTTASDVWSLGVLLFELLTGARPFGTFESTEEAARAVLAQEPVRPSVAAREARARPVRSGEGEADRAEGRRRARALEGDLDNILLKALAKDPQRRYSSAERLSEDLRRHLAGLPVRARPEAVGYVVGKFIRRHRWGIAGAGLVVLALVGGIAGTSWQAMRARAERARADAARARAEELVDFMLGDLRRKLEPSHRIGVLDDVAKAVQGYFAQLPPADVSPGTALRKGRLFQQLAEVRLLQGDLDAAAALVSECRAALSEAGGEGTPDAAIRRLAGAAANLAGRVAEERGDLEKALAEHTRAFEHLSWVARERPASGASSLAAEAANDIGRVLLFLGRLPEARARHEEALAMLGAAPIAAGDAGREWKYASAKNWISLGRVKELGGDAAGAEEAYRRNLVLAEEMVRELPSGLELRNHLAISHNDLGRVLRQSRRPAEAEGHHAAALAVMEGLLREDPDNAIWLEGLGATYSFLGRCREELGDVAGARAHFSEDAAISERLLAKEPASALAKAALADALTNVGRGERLLGAFGPARAAHERALALRLELSADKPQEAVAGSDVGVSRLELGRLLAAEGQAASARAQWESARGLFAAAAAQDASVKHRSRLAQALLELGFVDEARPVVRELAAGSGVDRELAALAARKGIRVELGTCCGSSTAFSSRP